MGEKGKNGKPVESQGMRPCARSSAPHLNTFRVRDNHIVQDGKRTLLVAILPRLHAV